MRLIFPDPLVDLGLLLKLMTSLLAWLVAFACEPGCVSIKESPAEAAEEEALNLLLRDSYAATSQQGVTFLADDLIKAIKVGMDRS